MDKIRQQKIGLYDPKNEHDACGIGFVANIKGVESHSIVNDGLEMLENLEHRGAVGSDKTVGDGAGILTQIPDEYFRKVLLKSKTESYDKGYQEGANQKDNDPCLCGFWGNKK